MEEKKRGRPKLSDSQSFDVAESTPPESKSFKIQKKGDTNFRHDLFLLENAIVKKNTTPYLKKRPKIEDIEHKHFFHSFDTRRGKKLLHTELKQAHVHFIDLVDLPNGEIKATCGPAKRWQPDFDNVGEEKGGSWVDCTFPGVKGLIIDDHTHEMTYIGSQVMSVNLNKAHQSKTAKDIAAILKSEE